MKLASPIAVALFIATPALASGSVDCEAADRSGLTIVGNYSGRSSSRLEAVTLGDGARTFSTRGRAPQLRIVRHVETRLSIRLELQGPGRTRTSLRVWVSPDGASAGRLVYRGRSHPMQCEFG